MCSQLQLEQIMHELMHAVEEMTGARLCEAILYGSYARREADDDSDIDVMLLMNMSRDEIPSYRRMLAEVAGRLLCEHGVVVSPVMESDEFFQRNRKLYPFFMNVDREGIRYAA